MSKYSDWASLASHEEAIATGRMSAEALVAHPSLGSLSFTGRLAAAIAEILAERNGSSVLTPVSAGGVGDGVADDTTALATTLTTAAGLGRAVIDLGGRTWRTTAPLAPTAANLTITNGRLLKAHTGDLFSKWDGNYGALVNVTLDADTATSATYGTTGVGLHFSSGSASFGFQWIGGGSQNIDHVIDVATDAAHASLFMADFVPYTVAPGSEPDAIYLRGDTTAAFRRFIGCHLVGNYRLDGALDTFVVGGSLRTVVTDDNVSIVVLQCCVLANNDNPHTFKGTNLTIQGNRLSGSATLSANSSGTWTGNMFTSGSLTDSSGGYLWQIHHRVESSALVSMVDGHLLRRGFAGIIAPNSVLKPGNAAVSTQNSATPTGRTILFNSAITADRAVTLNTGSDYKDGDWYHVIRTAAATGAFNVNVGSGPLKALAPGTWCIVTYDGSNWFLTAYGAL